MPPKTTPAASVVIYHNPRCSKSRQTLELLQQQGITPQIQLYLEQAPSKTKLKEILKKLGIPARNLMRKSEPLYKELGLADPAMTETQLIEAMVQHPILIERPIVLANNKAALGRPPEAVLDILR